MTNENPNRTIKKNWALLLFQVFIAAIFWLQTSMPSARAALNQVTPTDTETPTPTPTQTDTPIPPTPTNTITPTLSPQPVFTRPLVVISWYAPSSDSIYPGDDFDLKVQLYNSGKSVANNVVISFKAGDFIARQTGGVIAVKEVTPDNHETVLQPLTASQGLYGVSVGSLQITISYTDQSGTAYQENFTISIPIAQPRVRVPSATPTSTATPTPTPSSIKKAQLVVTRYSTDVTPLQPGVQFMLDMEIKNLGNADARTVTLVVGGGNFNSSGTPDAGGIAGGSGEFTNFAPLGASNIQTLGDLAAGAVLHATMPLIVNVTTNPAAYPMKVSLVYADAKGNILSDEQVITLLVYSLPLVEVGFYRDPNPLYVSQTSILPLQITNLGRKSVLLGNMKVSAPNADMTNNSMLVGALDAGGYFTLDANLTAQQSGPLEISIVIDYTDDFNQQRQINKTLNVEIQEFIQPTFEPDNGGGVVIEQPETFLQKIWRFILGLFGLDSGKQQTGATPGESKPIIEPVSPNGQPLKGP